MNLVKCLSGIAITFFLTTSVAADFAFTPEQAGDVVQAYENSSPDPLADDNINFLSGRQSAIDCQNNAGDDETCGAGLCAHVTATYDLIRTSPFVNCADASAVTMQDSEDSASKTEQVRINIDSCKGPLGDAQNIFKPLANFCRCGGATTC